MDIDFKIREEEIIFLRNYGKNISGRDKQFLIYLESIKKVNNGSEID